MKKIFTQVIKHWVDTWTANTTQEEFKHTLEAICKKLDKPDRVKHCLHVVDDWYVPWFQYLLHEVNPHQICLMVGLCEKTTGTQVGKERHLILVFVFNDGVQDDDRAAG